jgi:4-amino-4-deoxy-L-arabinose transferase-like glycosyltransferase
MESIEAFPVDREGATRGQRTGLARSHYQLVVLLFAAAVFLGCIISPPGLMDDVDAVQAQIARNMLESGDWVTARLNGVPYLEKSPLKYWLMALSFAIFGVHDWAARLPVALAAILLAWLTARFGAWAFGRIAGMYAGLVLATCVGMFLFTRVQIADVMLTCAVTLGIWSLLRALDEAEPQPRLWAHFFWASIGAGLLLKGLIAAVFPVGAGMVFLLASGELLRRETWRRLCVFSGVALMLLIAAPWHVLATLRNPPYLDFTLRSEPGVYRGFFWFYFLNEHVLRFLNLRYPRDYNTVPRHLFWLFHLLWLFPWSVYFPSLARLDYRSVGRAARVRKMALCWAGFILAFFTFSTTQEYYSMPAYPALALLLGSVIAQGGRRVRIGTRAAAIVAAIALAIIAVILASVWNLPAPGDIASALTQNPDVYTLSLGHMTDLTWRSFAYLRAPLMVAAAALLIGVIGAWKGRVLALAVMMVVFFHAARLALVVFDPYLGSRPLAEALLQAPPGELIVDDQYYAFSSVFFYTNRRALLLNGRKMNLEYGSSAPGAPDVFIEDAEFPGLWSRPERWYVVTTDQELGRFERLVGKSNLHRIARSGGKSLLSNQPL